MARKAKDSRLQLEELSNDEYLSLTPPQPLVGLYQFTKQEVTEYAPPEVKKFLKAFSSNMEGGEEYLPTLKDCLNFDHNEPRHRYEGISATFNGTTLVLTSAYQSTDRHGYQVPALMYLNCSPPTPDPPDHFVYQKGGYTSSVYHRVFDMTDLTKILKVSLVSVKIDHED